MNFLFEKFNEKILKYILIVLFVFYSFFALSAYTSDSEFWSIALAKILYVFDGHIGLLQKIPFYFLLNLPYQIFDNSILVLLFAKLLFYLVSLGIFYFCYKILRFYDIEGKWILVFFILLSLSEMIFGQTFRIRSDNLSLLLFLVLFYFSLRDPKDSPGQNLKLFLLSLLMFLSTPKAIYFVICFFAFHIFQQNLFFKRLKSFLIFCLLPPFICFFAANILDLFGSAFLKEAYTKAALYFFNSFSYQSFQSTYLSLDSFNFLLRTIYRSPIHFIFVIVALILGVRFRKNLKKAVVFLIPVCILALLFILLHNQKLPFFINSLMLPVLLFSYIIFVKTKSFIKIQFSDKKIELISFVFLFVLYSLFQVSHLMIKQNGLKQISIISKMQTYFAQYPESDIYDGIGILNSGRILYSFAGPGDKGLKSLTLDMLQSSRPDFIIYTPKLYELEPQLSLLLEYQYIPIANGVWAHANQNEGHTLSTSFNKIDLDIPFDVSYYFGFEWPDYL